MQRSTNNSDVFLRYGGLLFFIVTLVGCVFASVVGGIDPHHDSITTFPAFEAAKGAAIYRDSFTQYGGLFVFIQGLVVKYFGYNILVLRCFASVLCAITAVLNWFIWSRFLDKNYLVLVSVIWFINMPVWIFPSAWANVDIMILWSAIMFIITCKTDISEGNCWKYAKNITIGVLSGFIFWHKPHSGVILLLGSLVMVIGYDIINIKKIDFKKTILVIIGFAAVASIGILILHQNGTYDDFIKQSSVMGGIWLKRTRDITGLSNLLLFLFSMLPLHNTIAYSVSIIFTVIFSSITVYKLYRNKYITETDATVAIIAFGSIISWLQQFPYISDTIHAFWSNSIFFGIIIYMVPRFRDVTSLSNRKRFIVTTVAMIFVFYFESAGNIYAIRYRINDNSSQTSYSSVFGGIFVNNNDLALYGKISSEVDNFLKVHPSGVMINDTSDAIYPIISHDKIKQHNIMYINWGFNDLMYSDYSISANKYVSENNAIIIHFVVKADNGHPYFYKSLFRSIPKNYICVLKDMHIDRQEYKNIEIQVWAPADMYSELDYFQDLS